MHSPGSSARYRRALAVSSPLGDTATAGQPTVSPVDYGADPTGVNDSSAAFTEAMRVMTARNTSGHATSFGLADLGGATLDLGGGDYLLSQPLVFPVGFANARIMQGTLRASAAFPVDRFLVEMGAGCTTDSCNADLTLHSLCLDSNQRAGGLLVNGLFGGVLTQLYVLNFTTVGISVVSGHEVMISNAWLGEWLPNNPRRENYTASVATGILLLGNDHYVSDTVVFASRVGLNVSGAANIVTGLHTWGLSAVNGGIGVVVNAPQTRLLGVYMDGNGVLITLPLQVSVHDSFFLPNAGLAGIVIDATATTGWVEGLSFRGNQFVGTNAAPISVAPGSPPIRGVQDVFIEGNVDVSRSLRGVEATTDVVSAAPTTLWVANFTSALLFDTAAAPIVRVTYTAVLDGGAFARHAARAPVGGIVTVETDAPVSGRITIAVTQAVN